MEIPKLSACSSKKDPVPAAQTLFISKSTMAPFSKRINLESCPPISIIVSTSGSMAAAAFAWAVISFLITSAPTKSPTKKRPEPVVAAPKISTLFPHSVCKAFKPCFTASNGLPAVIKYCLASNAPCSSINTKLVLTEPTSMPKYTGIFLCLCSNKVDLSKRDFNNLKGG